MLFANDVQKGTMSVEALVWILAVIIIIALLFVMVFNVSVLEVIHFAPRKLPCISVFPFLVSFALCIPSVFLTCFGVDTAFTQLLAFDELSNDHKNPVDVSASINPVRTWVGGSPAECHGSLLHRSLLCVVVVKRDRECARTAAALIDACARCSVFAFGAVGAPRVCGTGFLDHHVSGNGEVLVLFPQLSAAGVSRVQVRVSERVSERVYE